MKVGDIMRTILARGMIVSHSSERNLLNSIYGLMMRNPDIFTRVGKGEFDLIERQQRESASGH